MSRSNIASQAPQRPKIFDTNWPKRPLTIPSSFAQQPRRTNKKNQSLRAQQALRKSLMIMVNINSFLKQKQKISNKCIQYANISQKWKRQLQKLSRQNGKPFDDNKYEEMLKNYYLHIREQTKYMTQVQSFVLSNLQNYDSRTSAPKFTRLPGEAYKQLQQKLSNLQQKRMRVQQTLTMFQQNIQQSQILKEQFNFQVSLQNLLKELNQQRLQQIHYLMLYQLQQTQRMHAQFNINIENDKSSYAIFQAINDSMKLMVNQRQEMRKDRHLVDKAFNDLRMENADYIVPSSTDSLPILLKNQKVYDANKQLLARYNAQTNLIQYANRRKSYIEQLSKYKTKLTKWKQQQQIGSYLYNRHQILNRYIRRLSLGQNNATIRSQRQDVKRAYYDCLNLQIPQNMQTIRRYKTALISDIGDTLQKQGIIMTQRNQLLNSSKLNNSILIHRQQNKFHKYLNFFIQLQHAPNNNKVQYLSKNKDTIKALRYQLSQSYLDSAYAQNYKIDLDYCQAITNHQQNNQDDVYIRKVQDYRKIRWVGLPIGLDSIVFYYTNDVFLNIEGNRYINQVFSERLQQISNLVQSDIKRKKFQSDQSRQKQYPYRYFNLKPQQRRYLNYSILRKISIYSPKIKKQIQNKYWNQAQQLILLPYTKAIQGQKKFQVLKKHFFTFRILSYLKKQGGNIKLSNFQQLVQYYIDNIDKQKNKWDQTDLFMEIIKQRIFIKFLKDQSKKKINVEIQLLVMEKINQACILLYESNDHIALVNSTDLQSHLQYGVKIHQAWQQLIKNFELNPNKNKMQIQQKCKQFINGIKKSPIQIGTKANLQQIQSMLNINVKIQKLKIINGLPSGMAFLSAIYIRCSNLLNVQQNLIYSFSHSDVLMPRQAIDKVLYLEKVQENCKREISIIKPHLLRIISIYKGKPNQKQQLNNKNITQIERILIQIIGKLESIRK